MGLCALSNLPINSTLIFLQFEIFENLMCHRIMKKYKNIKKVTNKYIFDIESERIEKIIEKLCWGSNNSNDFQI